MRSWYVSRRSEPILNKRMMVLFAAALVLVLFWLLPREQTFRDMLANQQADRVSIAYAKLLLSVSPEDDELAYLLAGQYYQLGEWDEAWRIIQSARDVEPMLGIKVLERITYGLPEGDERNRWQKLLGDRLIQAVSSDALSSEGLTKLADLALSLNKPRIAAGLFERNYLDSQTPEDLVASARAWIAADAADEALRLLLRADVGLNEQLVTLSLQAALGASELKTSLSIIDTYLSNLGRNQRPSTAMIQQLVRALLASGRTSRVTDVLRYVRDADQMSFIQAMELAEAAIASGNLNFAKQFMERALELRGDQVEVLEQTAKVYDWSGEPELAIELWLRASQRSRSDAATERAWRLSRDLYQYRNVAELLGKIAERRKLSDEEVVGLRLAWEQYGTPAAGIEVLQSYLREHPDHRQAWRELIAVQTNDLQLAAASESWHNFALHHVLANEETQAQADILWRQFRPHEAIDVLLQSRPRERNSAFWQQLATYAWFLDEPELVAQAFERRLQLGDVLSQYEMSQLVQASIWSDSDRVAEHAYTAWRDSPAQIEPLLTALQTLMQDKKYMALETLFAEVFAAPAVLKILESNIGFWSLRANFLQIQGDLDGAQLALQKALELAPQDNSLQASRVWILIAKADTAELSAALEELADVALEGEPLWPPFASGYALLGQHRKAAAWFERAAERAPNDSGLLLAYSGTLEALGHRDPAFRLRRHVTKLLLSQVAEARAQSIDADALMAISRDVLSGPEQRSLLRRLISITQPTGQADAHTPTAGAGTLDANSASQRILLAQFEFADALRRAHYSAARYWLNKGVSATKYDQLAIAIDGYNKGLLGDLAGGDSYDLSWQAALALGETGYAQRILGDELLRRPGNSAAEQSYISLRSSEQPSGWQAGSMFEELGNFRFQITEVSGTHHFDNLLVSGEIRYQQTTQDLGPSVERFSELAFYSQLEYDNRFGAGSVGLSYIQGARRSVFGMSLQQDWLLDRRNALTLQLEKGARLSGAGVSQALLSRSGAQLNWRSELSGRLQLNSNLQVGSFFDHRGERLGDVQQFSISPNYLLSRAGPAISLRGQALWIESSALQPGPQLQQLLGFSPLEVLPADSRSLSLGAVLFRDEPGELGWQYGGAHYRFSIDVGFRWPQQKATFSNEAAIAVPLFGRDRITASVKFTNSLDNQVGEKGVSAQLKYTRQLH